MSIPEPPAGRRRASLLRVKLLALAAAACGVAAVALLPHAIEAGWLLAVQDDPAALADRKLARSFNADIAAKEIEAALAANDAELAKSFVDLAHDRNVTVAPELASKVDAAVEKANSALSTAGNFTRGLIVGEPDDLVSLAGTAVGDLFVFGDIRDMIREGSHLAAGQEADHLILGLSAVGIAVTAGTYASLGTGAPARMGLSLVKAARKTGRISSRMAGAVTRSLRSVVDWSAMRKAFAGASLTEPAVAVRAAREAVKLNKADDLFRLSSNIGSVQGKAGTRAALDGLRISDSPREMARVAKLAEKEGGKTRAILKLLGRGAIALTVAAFDLSLWVLWAALTIFGFIASTKAAVERVTWRALQRGKVRRAKRELARQRRLAMAPSQV
ncbi:hypothetical protein [Pseudorhodoplanes sinuspersici]|uniref:hypothetical protein n=1 Tax=Pseudorhodoplanes sinuspersici TaxID=1235591 RepID=UPI000FF76383|nr:hypothetical protein [Pseudorhodoplanes sinuspersici]RKE72909.1 hypothetical protein DFP91_0782 [Pseudorhodoplanes sinuspersici]